MEPRTLHRLLIGFRSPLLPLFYRRMPGIRTGVPYLSSLRRGLLAGRGLPRRPALGGGAARRLLLRPVWTKGDVRRALADQMFLAGGFILLHQPVPGQLLNLLVPRPELLAP